MSKLKTSLLHYSRKAGGSHGTQEARGDTASALATFMDKSTYQIQDAKQLRTKHIVDFIQHLIAQGLNKRTLQNRTSHIRKILGEAGKEHFARSAIISNAALGISGGSRIGTKRASTENERKAAIAKSIELGRPGFAAVLKLTYLFGLRRTEAICASVEILMKWKKELEEQGFIEVFKATKGGRRRYTPPLNYELAIETLNAAIAIAEKQGGHLIPSKHLKQAVSIYRNFMTRHGFVGHCNRYAYSCERIAFYKKEGHSEKNATNQTSQDLGHGNRGRWVKSIYNRPANSLYEENDPP